MGGGIWSMHFTGMLAYKMEMLHTYSPFLTILSILVAVLFSYTVFYNVTQNNLTIKRILLNAPLMGLGVAVMHYTGMAAMHIDGHIKYHLGIFIASIVIAIVASGAAMWIMFFVSQTKKSHQLLKVLSALIMGLAVCGMHYTGMEAAVFIPFADCRYDPGNHNIGLAVTVICISLLLSCVALFLISRELIETKFIISKNGFILGIAFIVVISVSIIFVICNQAMNQYEKALFVFKQDGHIEAQDNIDEIKDNFSKINNMLEIISKSASLNKNRLHEYDSFYFKEIYDYLAHSAGVKELYIVNAGATLEHGISQYNNSMQISRENQRASNNVQFQNIAPNLYLILSKHLAWFSNNQAKFGAHSLSFKRELVSQALSLCNNPDQDLLQNCLGYVISRPYYDSNNNLAGIVSITILQTALAHILTNDYYAIINNKDYSASFKNYEFSTVKQSMLWIKQGKANPNLLYSETIPIEIDDAETPWVLWVGFPNTTFLDETGREIKKHMLITCFALGLFSLVIILVLSILRYNYRLTEGIKSASFAQLIMDAVSEPIFVKDKNHVWRAGNKAFWKMVGGDPEKFLGRSDHDIFPPEQVAIFFEKDNLVVNTGQVNVNEELVTQSDGSVITAITTKSPLTLPDGTKGLVGVINDISSRKQLENEINNHRQYLQELVDERTSELKQALDKAEIANKTKSQFLSNISHELRTPMHSIISFSRQGISRINKYTLPEHEENLGLIKESGERLLLLLNDLLDLSKLESGAMEYDMRQHDITSLINSVIRQNESIIRAKELQMKVKAEDSMPYVSCDAVKISQVILNLVSNAVKFTPNGKPINITVKTAENASVLIAVEDQGVGIPENELETVFDKFVQSSKTKTGAGGTGLGLAICKEIITAHKGRIWAENNSEIGACFFINLPIHNDNKGKENV